MLNAQHTKRKEKQPIMENVHGERTRGEHISGGWKMFPFILGVVFFPFGTQALT